MRTLLGMLVLSLMGCDSLWGGYIGTVDAGIGDAGGQCGSLMSCDLSMSMVDMASTPPDLYGLCTNDAACTPPQVCDLNTGNCVDKSMIPTGAFIPGTGNVALPARYQIMAVADFDGDNVADVAVSGLFNTSYNPDKANYAPVEIFWGDKKGGLTATSTKCDVDATNRAMPNSPVYLLPIPNASNPKRNDILVATYGTNLYRCVWSGASWTPMNVTLAADTGNIDPLKGVGFKQLALINDEGHNNVDLMIRNNKTFLPDPSNSGALAYYGSKSATDFTNISPPSFISNSDIAWTTPIRFAGDSGDSAAVVQDDADTIKGVTFYYLKNDVTTPGVPTPQGAAVVPGGSFSAPVGHPFAATALLHQPAAAQPVPSILYSYSAMNINTISVLYCTGKTSCNYQSTGQRTPLSFTGLVTYPYGGDANGDGVDEIGVYTVAPSPAAQMSHVQLMTYKAASGTISTPIFEIISTTNVNYRGMALAFLADPMGSDLRSSVGLKDLIVLAENVTGNSSVMTFRANRNYKYQ